MANEYSRAVYSQQNLSVNSGELNKRIEIIEKATTRDPDGYPDKKESCFYSCWAKFTRTSGREKTAANSDFSEINVRFLIRYTKKEITRKMLVRYAGDDYEIVYLNDYGDSHRFIEVWCKQLTRKG